MLKKNKVMITGVTWQNNPTYPHQCQSSYLPQFHTRRTLTRVCFCTAAKGRRDHKIRSSNRFQNYTVNGGEKKLKTTVSCESVEPSGPPICSLIKSRSEEDRPYLFITGIRLFSFTRWSNICTEAVSCCREKQG